LLKRFSGQKGSAFCLLKIAQHFSAGSFIKSEASPAGTEERFFRPCGTREFSHRYPALKCWAIFSRHRRFLGDHARSRGGGGWRRSARHAKTRAPAPFIKNGLRRWGTHGARSDAIYLACRLFHRRQTFGSFHRRAFQPVAMTVPRWPRVRRGVEAVAGGAVPFHAAVRALRGWRACGASLRGAAASAVAVARGGTRRRAFCGGRRMSLVAVLFCAAGVAVDAGHGLVREVGEGAVLHPVLGHVWRLHFRRVAGVAGSDGTLMALHAFGEKFGCPSSGLPPF